MSQDASEEAYQNAVRQVKTRITGMNLESARNILNPAGWSIRVLKTEDGPRIGTRDFRRNRLNVETVDDRIIKVISVG
jgi:hypothetical protein